MNNKPEQDILHIHPQFMNHSPVRIKGTREGLLLLQKAINALVSCAGSPEGISQEFATFAADGEGYEVTVEMLPPSALESDKLPYIDGFGNGCYRCSSTFSQDDSQDEQMASDGLGEF